MAELRISSPPLSLNGSRRRHVCTNRTVVKLRPRRPLWKTPLHFAATDGMSLTPAPPLRRRPSSPIPALWARWRRSGMSSNSQPGARKRTRSSFLWCVYLSGQSKRARSRGIENAKPVNFQKRHHPRAPSLVQKDQRERHCLGAATVSWRRAHMHSQHTGGAGGFPSGATQFSPGAPARPASPLTSPPASPEPAPGTRLAKYVRRSPSPRGAPARV
jgi:hypothetical protein